MGSWTSAVQELIRNMTQRTIVGGSKACLFTPKKKPSHPLQVSYWFLSCCIWSPNLEIIGNVDIILSTFFRGDAREELCAILFPTNCQSLYKYMFIVLITLHLILCYLFLLLPLFFLSITIFYSPSFS